MPLAHPTTPEPTGITTRHNQSHGVNACTNHSTWTWNLVQYTRHSHIRHIRTPQPHMNHNPTSLVTFRMHMTLISLIPHMFSYPLTSTCQISQSSPHAHEMGPRVQWHPSMTQRNPLDTRGAHPVRVQNFQPRAHGCSRTVVHVTSRAHRPHTMTPHTWHTHVGTIPHSKHIEMVMSQLYMLRTQKSISFWCLLYM